MECYEYEKLFEKYFDREITILEYKAVRTHLSRCSQCREVFFNHLFALDLLDSIPSDEPTELLAERVLQNLPKTNGTTSWRRWTVGIAACVILALSLTVVEQTMDKASEGIKTAVVASNIEKQMKTGKHPVVLPNNTILKGNLRVHGDMVVLGKVYGKIQADRVVIVRSEDSEIFHTIGEKVKNVLKLNRAAKP